MLRKKIPMDMILFYGFFASGRLPGYERDLLVNYSIKGKHFYHLITGTYRVDQDEHQLFESTFCREYLSIGRDQGFN